MLSMTLASGFLSYAFTFFFTSVALYFWSLVRLPGFRSFVVVMQKASVGSDEAAGLRLHVTREAVLEAAGGAAVCPSDGTDLSLVSAFTNAPPKHAVVFAWSLESGKVTGRERLRENQRPRMNH